MINRRDRRAMWVAQVNLGRSGAVPTPPEVSPSVTPTNTQTPSITPSITPSGSVTPTPTSSVSVTPSNTVTPTSSVTPSITPTSSLTPTPSITPSITPSGGGVLPFQILSLGAEDPDGYISDDGTNFTGFSTPTNLDIKVGIAYSPDLDMYVSADINLKSQPFFYSTDGTTWTQSPSTFGNLGGVQNFVWSDHLQEFGAIAIQNSYFYTSSDGINWTQHNVPWNDRSSTLMYDEDNLLYIVADEQNGLWTSPDAITWTLRSTGINTQRYTSLGRNYSLGLNIYANGTEGNYAYSTDGINWSAGTITNGYTGALSWAIALPDTNNHPYAAMIIDQVSTSGVNIARTTDGINWTGASISSTTQTGGSFVFQSAWDDTTGTWWITQYAGDIMYSTDYGDTWTHIPSTFKQRPIHLRQ